MITNFGRSTMKELKYSRQREAIKEFLATRKDHPTADVVYMNVRKEYPNISLGTVYRNLTLLAEQGEISRIRVGDGTDRFDPTTKEHFHFVCKNCGSVIDLDVDGMDDMAQQVSNNFGGSIDGHVTYFFGSCKNCIDLEALQKCNS